jgi:hypothetical protein
MRTHRSRVARRTTPRRERRVADLLRFAIVGAALAATAGGEHNAAIKCGLLVPPTVLSRSVKAPGTLDFAFTLGLAVEAIGSASGVNASQGWNTMAHLVLPLLSGPLLYHGLARLELRIDGPGRAVTRPRVAIAAITFAGVLALGTLWELVEWASDSWLGTSFATSYEDTMGDLLHDAIAAVGSGALTALWHGSAARRPQ